MRTASTRQDRRVSTTHPSRPSRPSSPADLGLRRLPTRAQLDLPVGPVPESQRAAVTVTALRATVAEWREGTGLPETRAVRELAAAAHVAPAQVTAVLRQDARTDRGLAATVEPGLAARLLWVMREPLRADLRVALAADLAAEVSAA